MPAPVVVTSLRVATVKVGTGKKAKSMAGIVLQFSGALNVTQAKSLAPYQLIMAGKDKKFGTKDDKKVALSQAIYNAKAYTVSIVPKQALNKTQLQQLRVKAALLSDTYGRPIDGNHDGQPGGDLVATIKGKSVTIQNTTQAQAESRLTAMAIDALMLDPALISHPFLARRIARMTQ
jgi:hypothetical protein